MKFGFRVPSLKRRIAARTSWKRVVRHSLGLKMPRGTGFLTNPKRALYNKIYQKTSFGIEDIVKPVNKSTSKTVSHTNFELPSLPVYENKKYPILDKHFAILDDILRSYKFREQSGMLEKAIEACRQQISISSEASKAFLDQYPGQPLPAHTGFEQLSIILSNKGQYKEAVELCQQAKREGWSGNWDRRIERYTKA